MAVAKVFYLDAQNILKLIYQYVNLPFSGLRLNNVGEQCEAIMKFPNLIGQFPFPVLINTAFLKLADVFWSGYVYFGGGGSGGNLILFHFCICFLLHTYNNEQIESVINISRRLWQKSM